MALSTCIVALLLTSLGSLVELESFISSRVIGQENTLTVQLMKSEPHKTLNAAVVKDAVRSIPQESIDLSGPDDVSDIQREAPLVVSTDPPPDPPLKTDWQEIAKDTAEANVTRSFKTEKSRASMWQQSRSIMFKPDDAEMVMDQEPLLSNIRFIERSRVLGLGVNFGSCFFGIPIAGVPVEDRSAAISIFVCTGGS